MTAGDSTIDQLERLPEDERAVLMGLAGVGLPTTNSHLARVMAEAGGFPQARAWAANPRKIQELLLNLKTRSLVETTRQGYWTCSAHSLESAARMAFARGVLRRLHQGAVAGTGYGSVVADAQLRCRAELRLAFLEGDHERWLPLRQRFAEQFGGALRYRDPLSLICGGPFEPAWFEALDPAAQAYGCQALLLDQVLLGLPSPAFLGWLELQTGRPRATPSALTILLFLTLQGRLEEARGWKDLQSPRLAETYGWSAVAGMGALAAGQPAAAAAAFEESLVRLRKLTRKRNCLLPGLFEPFHILALLGLREPQSLRRAQDRIDLLGRRDWDDPLLPTAGILGRLAQSLAGAPPDPRRAEQLGRIPAKATALQLFLELLAAYLAGDPVPPELPERALRACQPLPLGWFSSELGELRNRLQDQPPRPSPLLDLVPREAAWERALDSLAHLGETDPAPRPRIPGKPVRLAWYVTPDPWVGDLFKVEAREQKQDVKGLWSRGRTISLRRLREETRAFDYLTAQDLRVVGCIRVERDGYGGMSYAMEGPRVLPALVGHPCLHWVERGEEQPVELLEGQPELRIRQAGVDLELTLDPPPGPNALLVRPEGRGRMRVFAFTDLHRRLDDLLGAKLVVPASAQDRVLRSLAAVAPLMPVHSDLGVAEDASARAGLETVAGDTLPTLVLLPAGEGLRVQARVSPLPGGPLQIPGQGGSSLVLEQDGRRLLVRRRLEAEVQAVETLLEALPVLEPDFAEAMEKVLAQPDHCLELMLQLEAVKDRVAVLWPEGRALQTPRTLGPDALKLRVAAKAGWLEVNGDVRVDASLVLDLKTAMELLESHPGRFVPLGDGAFLAITQAFRHRLQDLGAMGERRTQGLRLHPVAALALDELDQGLAGDRAFQGQLARIRAAMALEPPIPQGLEAELRSYQEEGFRWMMRLAEAGFGACLADDMGLGKTVQALALLLARGAAGPALVVAPTSVCANWALEAARFAPGLRVLALADGDRAALLDQAGPMDLVIASYALLHLEAEKLRGIQWATAILDEAQNIKNAFTKRSQSAMALQAGFRVVLSGTPMENHLGELWNLFRFLNPGLLGSLEQFQVRFQVPVERNRDAEALRRLKRLTAPFLLRRTKAQVMDELPRRTEVTLELAPSAAETAFLEALRLRSLEQLEAAGGGTGGQPMLVLAAITRLRRACCAPDLIDPGLGIASSKQEAFLELVQEIRDNRHRALVFSQFVDHLALLRRCLDRQGIPYHYLDGSTPPKDRAAAVAAFQRGDRDLFLISLKAGGTGLNLTGADTVIHMDPWWNPAVEDQASDRAHRIGQTRPVTIYRLVLKGTIEQKIVSLHSRKRQLADRLLEETGTAARLDAAGLLELLRN